MGFLEIIGTFICNYYVTLCMIAGLFVLTAFDIFLDRTMIVKLRWTLVLLFLLLVFDRFEIYFGDSDHIQFLKTLSAAVCYTLRPMIEIMIVFIVKKDTKWWIVIPALFNAGVAFSGFFSGIAYSFDENGNFARGPLGVTPFIVSFIYLLYLLYISVRMFSKRSVQEGIAVLFGAAVISFIDRGEYVDTMIAVALLMYYLYVYSQYAKRDAKINDDLVKQLSEQTEAAVAANRAKSAFLSNMSHEIRTPINAILGMNEMILRESEDKDILEYSENVRTAGNTLLGIVNDILDFSKIEAGKMEIIPVDYDLSSVLNDLVNMVQTRADAKGLLIKPDFDKDIPKLLHGDEVRLKQVITNILTNAVKYTEKGSVTFGVTYEKPEYGNDLIDLKVWVKDTGIGIKADDMNKLFSKFERIEEERNRNVEGTGLGMNITRRLLEMMGSSLKVESVYGEGSTFSFSLMQKVVKWDPLGDYETAYKASLGNHKKYRERFTAPDAAVLMVDDTPMNLTVFKSLLKLTGIRIDTAASGDEGLALVRENKYDIIFLDHMMPEKDGIETLHEMQSWGDYPNRDTKKVCLTANAISGAREEYLAAGFDDYLTKPIDSAKLEEMLLEYLPKEKIHDPANDIDTGEDELFGSEPKLPDFVEYIGEISTDAGVTNCGSVEGYISALKTYAEMIGNHADETEKFWQAGDLENATIKIHAMKSTSRIIGAIAIGELAQKLETAGKEGDAQTVGAGIGELLERCRKLGAQLSPLRDDTEEAADDDALPPISTEELHEAYEMIKEANSMFQLDNINEIAESLRGYRIPDEEKERVKALIKAVDDLDYDKLTEILP